MFVNSCLLYRPSLWNLVSIYNKLHDHYTKKLCVSTVILPTNCFVLTQNWSLSWVKLTLWTPGFTVTNCSISMIRSENNLKSACASVFAERCIRTTVVYYEFSPTEYKRIKGVVGWLVTVLGRMKEREALPLTWTK